MRQISHEKGGSGQQSPIRVGWIEGENKFRIIDGFHRDAALIENSETSIYATVKVVTWDELYDDAKKLTKLNLGKYCKLFS